MATPSKVQIDKNQYCYHCGDIIESFDDMAWKKVVLSTTKGLIQKNRKFHIDCLLKYHQESHDNDLKVEENNAWDAVYQYFRKEYLELPVSTPLQSHEINRLLGLRVGKYIPQGNNTRILKRGYSFEVILITLKVCKARVRGMLANKEFKNHKHRIDSIMRIVTQEINDVQKRVDMQNKSNKKLEKDLEIEKPTFNYEEMYIKDMEKNKEQTTGAQDAINKLFGGKL